MPPTYQQNKKHIYKWRENNPEEWAVIQAKNIRQYYIHNGDAVRSYNRKMYQYHKQCKMFRNILI